MVVGSTARSSLGSKSPAVATLAVLTTLGPATGSTATSRVKPALSSAAIAPAKVAVTIAPAGLTFQTMPLAAEALHPAPAADTKLRPLGSVSVTVVTPIVAPLPRLVTENA